MAAANHMGGSRYLVVSNDITEPSQLVGKTISMTAEPEIDPEFLTWSKKLGIPADASSYNIVDMGSQDAMFALKAGQMMPSHAVILMLPLLSSKDLDIF